MEIIDIVNKVLKVDFINILTYFIFIKLTDYGDNDKLKTLAILIISIIEASLEVFLVQYIPVLPVLIVMYLIHGFVISKITNNKFSYSIIVTLASFSITYLVYIISVVITGVMLKTMQFNLKKNNTVAFVIIIGITCVLTYLIMHTRRLKHGVQFLKNKERVTSIGIIGYSLMGVTIILYSLINNISSRKNLTYLFAGFVIESICMFIWIKQKITKYYKQKLKEKTIEELENEIKEKDKEIKNILEENQRIATINHKYSNRIKALEGFSNKVMSKPEIVENMKVEFGDEFLNFEKQVQKLSKEYTMEMEKNIENKIPKTGIFGIDNILEYMNQEATKSNIKFNVKINGNINYMIENIVEQSKLETMLGDHIKDAIIAINSSNNTNKNILLILGIIDEHYEVCIYDTGIEFEIPTLLKLGLEQITTHKATGGSGIGFMTTFETLKSTKASLIIEEKHPMNKTDYTKAVRIKFDGKNEYRIYTYRAEEIKKENKNGRIIITNA